MTSRDMVYWLQGFFEISDAKELSPKQVDLIKRHLAMVFIHEIDPSMGNKDHQARLDKVHNPERPIMTSGSYLLSQSNQMGIGFDVRTEQYNC